MAWEKVKKNKGAAGVDEVTIARFEERKGYYLDTLHRKLREGSISPQTGPTGRDTQAEREGSGS